MDFKQHEDLPALNIIDANEVNSGTFEEGANFLGYAKQEINERVDNGEAFYFKNFAAPDLLKFKALISQLNHRFLPYTGAKVRNPSEESQVLYSPTSVPRYRKNFIHNEMAYQPEVPSKITLYCQQPGQGGETILSDQRKVWQSIRPEYREKMERKQLKFVRNLVNRTKLHDFLSQNFDFVATLPSWQNNFATDSKKRVEYDLEQKGFETRWTPKDDLVISCIIPPTRLHPQTGEKMWVNNSHLFQLHPGVYGKFLYHIFRAYLKFTDTVMTTCLYGDGEPMEEEVVSNILEATEINEISLKLNKGDFIYANNFTLGHGRKTFKGHRRLYFGLFP